MGIRNTSGCLKNRILKKRKNSSKFVYILAKQCRSHFNLTNIFDRKNFKIQILRRFEIITKTSYLKLVGRPCSKYHSEKVELKGFFVSLSPPKKVSCLTAIRYFL